MLNDEAESAFEKLGEWVMKVECGELSVEAALCVQSRLMDRLVEAQNPSPQRSGHEDRSPTAASIT